jgi:hypothetical protein
MKPVGDHLARLLSKVTLDTSGCWSWSGQMHRTGYALISMPADGRWRLRRAHRISWELHRGPIPEGLWVLHKCDNRICTNPDHLFLGDGADNMQDCAAKGRVTIIGKSRLTHCKHGHEFTPENTILTSRGHRDCRACQNAWQREYYQRVKKPRKLAAAIRKG